MSLDIVGRENLPNVYIKEVVIDSYGKNSLLANCSVYIKDLKDGQFRFQWYDNHDLRKTMKIMIVASTNQQFNENIRRGNYSEGFTPQHLKNIAGYNKTQVQHKICAIQALDKKRMATVAEQVEGGTLYTFAYKKQFIVPSNQTLSVFAVCYVDIKQFSVEENIDLSFKMINSFHGAVAGERVLLNGKVQNKTNLFFNGDNLWTGPVHVRPGRGFMAGSKHSSVAHPTLRRQEIQNTKVKDFRFFFKKKKRINRIVAQKMPFISNLQESFNQEGNFTGTFAFNMRQFFIQRTKYGDLLLQLNEDLFNSMLSKVKINQLVVLRENIIAGMSSDKQGTRKFIARRVIKSNSIITTHDYRPYALRQRYRYFNSKTGRNRDLYRRRNSRNNEDKLKSVIKEVHNTNSFVVRNFIFSDLDVSYQTAGWHRYALKLEFRDPTYDYVKDMLKNLKSGFVQYKMYKEKIALRINYDYDLDRTKDRFVTLQKDDSWINSIDVFLKYYDLLFDAREDEIRDLGQQLISLVNPRSATLKSVNTFFRQYQFLLNYFMKFFRVNDDLFNEPNTRGNVRVNPDSGKIKIDHKFENIVRFNNKKFRVDFLPKRYHSLRREPEAFPTISKRDMIMHANAEKNKYFKRSLGFTRDSYPLLDQSAIQSLNRIEEYSSAYFSPRSIITGDNVMDLTTIEKVDIADFNMFFGRFIRPPAYNPAMFFPMPKRTVEIINRTRSSFHIKKPRVIIKNVDSMPIKDVAASDVLGPGSTMAGSQEENVSIGNNIIGSNIKQVFSTFESSKGLYEVRTTTEYVMDSQSNILMKMVNSPKFSPLLLEQMPLQVKALLGSRQDFSRTNILASNMDLLASPITKDLCSVLFFVIAEIQYLAGYKMGKNGETNIKAPIWKKLTRSALQKISLSTLCRFKFYANKSLNIDLPTQSSYNMQNQYFYLGARMTGDNLAAINPLEQGRTNLLGAAYGALEQANQHPVEYASSIIINQPNSKNGPLKDIDYGVQRAEIGANNDFTRPAGAEPRSPSRNTEQPRSPSPRRNVGRNRSGY